MKPSKTLFSYLNVPKVGDFNSLSYSTHFDYNILKIFAVNFLFST